MHVWIAPCWDRKLERERAEFDGNVDLVLWTKELMEIIPDNIAVRYNESNLSWSNLSSTATSSKSLLRWLKIKM